MPHSIQRRFCSPPAKHGFRIGFAVRNDETRGGSNRTFIELRLLQQKLAISESITSQLEIGPTYTMSLSEQDGLDEVARIRNTVLSKVQDSKGKPIKFFHADSNTTKIVAIDITDQILGLIDLNDCKLAAYGDPAVDEVFRRGTFGLFQECLPEHPQETQERAKRYSHIRNTLHGVLFLFRKPNSGILSYSLEQYLMWNPAIVDAAKCCRVAETISIALPRRSIE
jgi:hypothetical protein